MQDSTQKIRWASIKHLQLLHSTEYVLNHLLAMTTFGWTMKYIKGPKLIPNLHAVEMGNKHKNNVQYIKRRYKNLLT